MTTKKGTDPEIVIERYNSPEVKMYKITGEFVDIVYNEHEFNKVRIQLVKKELTEKYYFMWNNTKIVVRDNGDIYPFPVGLYDQVQRDLAKLHKINRERKSKSIK